MPLCDTACLIDIGLFVAVGIIPIYFVFRGWRTGFHLALLLAAFAVAVLDAIRNEAWVLAAIGSVLFAFVILFRAKDRWPIPRRILERWWASVEHRPLSGWDLALTSRPRLFFPLTLSVIVCLPALQLFGSLIRAGYSTSTGANMVWFVLCLLVFTLDVAALGSQIRVTAVRSGWPTKRSEDQRPLPD
jgi:hypothetical protein